MISTTIDIICSIFIIEVLCNLLLDFSPVGLAKSLILSLVERFSAKPEPKKQKRVRIRITEGKVFHVGSLDGRNEIVHAKDEDEAKAVAAKAMAVPADDLIVEEVYEKVLRK